MTQTDQFAHERGPDSAMEWAGDLWARAKAWLASAWTAVVAFFAGVWRFVVAFGDALYVEFVPTLRTRTGANALAQFLLSWSGSLVVSSYVNVAAGVIMAAATAWYFARTLNGRKNANGPIINPRDHEPWGGGAMGPGAQMLAGGNIGPQMATRERRAGALLDELNSKPESRLHLERAIKVQFPDIETEEDAMGPGAAIGLATPFVGGSPSELRAAAEQLIRRADVEERASVSATPSQVAEMATLAADIIDTRRVEGMEMAAARLRRKDPTRRK